jgi:hypothetical protein
MAWRYAEFALMETDHFRAMYSSSLVPPHAEKHPSLSQAAISTFEEVVKVVETCQQEGFIAKNADAKFTTARFWGSIHGTTILLVDQQMSFLGVTHPQAQTIIKDQLNSHLEGLRTFTGS